MKIRFLLALVVSTSGLASLGAHAQQKAPRRTIQSQNGRKPNNRQSLHDEFSGQGYGAAGCGLGSIIFGPKPGLIQVVAATFNGTAGSQTFGITSGTSNCDIKESGATAAMFIEVNKEIVKKDAARGEGETVTALAEMLNCQSAAALGPELRSKYEYYFDVKNDSYEIVRRLYKNGICKAG